MLILDAAASVDVLSANDNDVYPCMTINRRLVLIK